MRVDGVELAVLSVMAQDAASFRPKVVAILHTSDRAPARQRATAACLKVSPVASREGQ